MSRDGKKQQKRRRWLFLCISCSRETGIGIHRTMYTARADTCRRCKKWQAVFLTVKPGSPETGEESAAR